MYSESCGVSSCWEMELFSELHASDILSLLERLYFAASPYLLIFTPGNSYENKLTQQVFVNDRNRSLSKGESKVG